jgi:hypothetical protein
MSGGSNLPLAGTPEQQVADPLHLFPNADNAGQPQVPGVPTTLPNLGAASISPKPVQGAFQAPNVSGGGFNAMAARGAGPLFNPAAMPMRTAVPLTGSAVPAGAAPHPVTGIDPALLAALRQRLGNMGNPR